MQNFDPIINKRYQKMTKTSILYYKKNKTSKLFLYHLFFDLIII